MKRIVYILFAGVALMLGVTSCSLLNTQPGYDEVVEYGTPYYYGGATYYYYNNYYYAPYYESNRYYVKRVNLPYGYGYDRPRPSYRDYDDYYYNGRDYRGKGKYGTVQGRRPNGNHYGNYNGNNGNHNGQYKNNGNYNGNNGNSGRRPSTVITTRDNNNSYSRPAPGAQQRDNSSRRSNVNTVAPRRATTTQGNSNYSPAPVQRPSSSPSTTNSTSNNNSNSNPTRVSGHRR